MCEGVRVLVTPLSSSKIFAQACRKDCDLLCSICKPTMQGVKTLKLVPDKQYTSDNRGEANCFIAKVSLNIFHPVAQWWDYQHWWGANENDLANPQQGTECSKCTISHTHMHRCANKLGWYGQTCYCDPYLEQNTVVVSHCHLKMWFHQLCHLVKTTQITVWNYVAAQVPFKIVFNM